MGESLQEKLARGRESKPARTSEDFAGILSGMLGGAQRFEVAHTTWPGTDVKIGLRLLSEWEVQQADSRARAWAEEKRIGLGRDRMNEREYVARYACELLSVALCDTSKKEPTPLVSCADELAKTATREELARLSTEMSDHQESLAPFAEQLTDEEMERLADAVGKAPRVAGGVLNTAAPSTLRRLCLLQGDRLRKLTGSSSSPLTPPGGVVPAS